jgi:pyruvate-formate lyase
MQAIRTAITDPTDAFPADEWRTTRPSARATRIKRRLLENVRQVDVERARFTTESYRATEGQPMPIRRAKMLLHLARSLSIDIHADEIIVGNRSLLPRMGVIAPEGAVDWIEKELDILPTRPQDTFDITPEQIRELREEIFPYWRGLTLEDTVAQRVPSDVRHVVDGKAFSLNQTDHAQGHILPDVAGWLHLGIDGLREKVERHGRVHQRPATADLLTSCDDCAGRCKFVHQRYADLACRRPRNVTMPVAAKSCAASPTRCRRLSTEPAQDFWDALQAVWFLFTLLQIESNASSFSPGRFDQYMLPYLQRDLDSGALTLEQAQDLLELLWLKFNEVVLLRSSSSARYFAGFPIGFNIAIGGLLPDAENGA